MELLIRASSTTVLFMAKVLCAGTTSKLIVGVLPIIKLMEKVN